MQQNIVIVIHAFSALFKTIVLQEMTEDESELLLREQQNRKKYSVQFIYIPKTDERYNPISNGRLKLFVILNVMKVPLGTIKEALGKDENSL